jgi:hypothetical protein
VMRVIKVIDKENNLTQKGNENPLDEIAQLYGAAEVIR